MQPTLVILAAGMGSRYGGLKQVAPLGPGGETIIDYSVYDAIRAGFGKVVFVIRKSIEQPFKEAFSQRFQKKTPYEIVFQELDMLPEGYNCPENRTKPWGTAHAVWVCKEVVKEPFAVVNADDFYGREAYDTLVTFFKSNYASHSGNYAMCGYPLKNTLSPHGSVTRGICKTDDQSFLLSVDEQLSIRMEEKGSIISQKDQDALLLDPEVTVSMNMWAFNPSIFPLLEEVFVRFLQRHAGNEKPELPIPEFVDDMISGKKGKVKVLLSQAQWFGVTYAEDKAEVKRKLTELLTQNQYPQRLWD
jgi:UTP-glucose-1-phosphate uridylyltransferase